MPLTPKFKRSAGVPVTLGVHRLITRGRAAQQRRDWAQAEAAYRDALTADPALTHIWVQLGHVLKEQRQPRDAEAAYVRAAALNPRDGDAHLHLGHLARQAGDHTAAGRHYLRAYRANPRQIEGVGEFYSAFARARGTLRDEMIEALGAEFGREPLPQPTKAPMPGSVAILVFDVSDLVHYFSHARLPTGIQRVQMEAIDNAPPDVQVHVCSFVQSRNEWVELPLQTFRSLIALSTAAGERTAADWTGALHRMFLRLTVGPAFAFPTGAVLINLGSSWQLHNYFLFVRNAKIKYGIRYIPFVHDLIPIVMPEVFTKNAVREFVDWAAGLFAHADGFLANSEATRRDLLRVAGLLGHEVPEQDVAVIPLDADPRTPGATPLPVAALAKWSLDQGPFVLFVSTIEPRKGHDTALDAWQALIAQHGAAKVPKLVCVGRDGWLNARIYERLDTDATLAGRVKILSGLSDAELDLLYRECQFTIYPSRYEGWGLPVTEALCHGKPVIAAETSSLPEAGGTFATYFQAGSAPQLAEAVSRMAFDAAFRAQTAARIAAGFKPRTWADVARQVTRETAGLATRLAPLPAPLPMARLGAYHPVRRGVSRRVWPGLASGEVFRAGTGWHAPTFDGCWTRGGGGGLAIGIPPGCGPVRAHLLLLGTPHAHADWWLRVEHGPAFGGLMRAGEHRWVSFDLPEPGPILRVHLGSEDADSDEGEPEREETGIGIAGFILLAHDDAASRLRVQEAIALGDLDSIDAYREDITRRPSSP